MVLAALEQMQGNPVFDAHPSPTAVLDTDLVFRAANRAFLEQAGRDGSDVLGRHVFDAFPDNPDEPESDGVACLDRSLRRVLHTGREHHMAVQRYDVAVLEEEGRFARRLWAPVNAPIREGHEVVGILHRVEEVTHLDEDLSSVLSAYRLVARPEGLGPDQARQFAESAAAFVAQAQEFRDLSDEVQHLRRALQSRSTIDQAKGMVMADRRCSADDAYKLLVRMSNETNVRLADVAAALVYHAQGTTRRHVRGPAGPALTAVPDDQTRDVS